MMLNFWKKENSKESRSPHGSPKKGVKSVSSFDGGCLQPVAGVVIGGAENVISGPLARINTDVTCKSRCERKSRLSLSLEDNRDNKIALSYFSQFMESKGLANLFNLLTELEGLDFRLVISQQHKRTGSSSNSPSKHYNSFQPGANEEVQSEAVLRRIISVYFSDDSSSKVKLLDDTLRTIILSQNNGSDATSSLNAIRMALYQQIKKEGLWTEFLKSDWHYKYLIEVMTSGTMSLGDVLYNDLCFASFYDFVEQEGFSSVMEFWLAATGFEKQYSEAFDSSPEQIQNDAMNIYDRYLSLQAIDPIGVSDRVRLTVETGICGEEERTSVTCFDPAIIAAEDFLTRVSLRPFLTSHQYLSLLADVMSSTSSRTTTTTTANHSPASSVITDGSVNHCVHPSGQDSLWRRSRHSGLCFGRIDSLGRYETDIEPEPDKKSESRISRVVKLLMNKDEQKTQEDMAWRVAEMIVKDITSVTMGSTNSDDDL